MRPASGSAVLLLLLAWTRSSFCQGVLLSHAPDEWLAPWFQLWCCALLHIFSPTYPLFCKYFWCLKRPADFLFPITCATPLFVLLCAKELKNFDFLPCPPKIPPPEVFLMYFLQKPSMDVKSLCPSGNLFYNCIWLTIQRDEITTSKLLFLSAAFACYVENLSAKAPSIDSWFPVTKPAASLTALFLFALPRCCSPVLVEISGETVFKAVRGAEKRCCK